MNLLRTVAACAVFALVCTGCGLIDSDGGGGGGDGGGDDSGQATVYAAPTDRAV